MGQVQIPVKFIVYFCTNKIRKGRNLFLPSSYGLNNRTGLLVGNQSRDGNFIKTPIPQQPGSLVWIYLPKKYAMTEIHKSYELHNLLQVFFSQICLLFCKYMLMNCDNLALETPGILLFSLIKL